MDFEDIPRFVDNVTTEWALNTGMCSLTTSLVHGIFIYRVSRLEKALCGKRKMTFVLVTLCVIEQVFGLLTAICIFKYNNNHNTRTIYVWSAPISLGCSAISDILIAVTVAYILHRNRTASPRTNQIITKLIKFSLQTGLITTVAAFITMGVWAASRFDICHLQMCFPIGGVYATCLLANSIARESYLQPQTVQESEISKMSFARFPQGLDLPYTNSGNQETSAMHGGTGFSKASSG